MHLGKTIVASAILSILGTTSARAAGPQVPHTFAPGTAAKASEVNENFAFLAARGKVYYKESTTYSTDNPASFSAATDTVMDTLTLPQGSYLVSAKLNAHTDDAKGWFVLVCGLSAGDGSDWVGVDRANEPMELQNSMLHMQVPVTITAATGTATVQCRVPYGQNQAGTGPVVLKVWGLKIMAVEVASVVKQ